MTSMTTPTNDNIKKHGVLTISRAMVIAGAIIIAGLVFVTIQQVQTIERIKVGGFAYSQIIDGQNFIGDILPPPVFPIEAYGLVHIIDSDLDLYQKLKPRLADIHKQYDERVAFWLKKKAEGGIIQTSAGDEFFIQQKKFGDEFWKIFDGEYIPAMERNDSDGRENAFLNLSKNISNFDDFIHKSNDPVTAAIARFQDGAQTDAKASQNFLMVLSVAIALAIGLVFLAAFFFVVRAITGIAKSMMNLAGGELETEVPYKTRSDEIGTMSHAVEVFKGQAILNRQNAQNSEYIIKALGEGLENLSSGNLMFRLKVAFPAEFERLRDYFNTAAQNLQETISSVKTGTDGIKSGTEEIAQASDDLSRRTENQAANLEQTAAAVAEITTAVKRTATGANQARGVVTAAKDEADRGGEVVRKAVDAMQGIEKSSQKVNQIIGVIDEIAFQTNLLALNAGVEAARAGDAGRGFAVVASEVRALAQRSADAAKEIKEILSTSRVQVQDGVLLVAETGTSLKQIIERVNEINKVVSEIAASAEQQASGLQEVNTAVDQMDQVTQQNAAMVEEATAATRTLTQQSGDLARVVSRFTTSAAAAINHVIENHRPVTSRAPLAPKKQQQPPSRAAAAAAKGAASNSDVWEEF